MVKTRERTVRPLADGRVVIDTELDPSQFEDGLKQLNAMTVAAGNVIADIFENAVSAIGSFASNSIEAGMSFDKSMSQVAATMGTTVDSIGELRDFALEMGSTTAFSASQAADALNYMALAGYDSATSMKMLPNVLNLAAAGGMELATASDMVTDAQSALGLSLSETSNLVDKMAKASSKTNTSVAQLGDAILTVGGTAKILHGGTTELATALGLLADNGIKASEGGTHLRNILLAMNPTTDAAANAWKKLGVSGYDAFGNLRPLKDTFGDLAEAMADMSDQERTDMISDMFNKTDISSINALLATNAERWDEVSEAVDAAWYSNESLNKELSDVGLSLDEMKSNMAALGVEGETFDQILNAAGGDVSAFTDMLWEATVGEVTDADVTRALGGDLDALATAFDNTTGAAEAMAETQLDNLAGDVTLFQSALEGAQIAVSDKLAPALRDVVQFGSSALETLTKGLQNGDLTGAISEVFSGLSASIKDTASQILPAIADGIRNQSDVMVTAGLATILSFVRGIISNVGTLASAGIEIISAFGEKITTNANKIVACGSIIVSEVINGISAGSTMLVNAGAEFINNLASGVATAIPTFLGNCLPLIVEFSGTLRANAGTLIDAGLNLIQNIAQGIADSIPVLVENVPTIVTNIAGVINDNAPKVLATGVNIIKTLAVGLIKAIPTIVANLPKIIKAIVSVFQAFNWINLGSSIITAVKNGIMVLRTNLPAALKKIGEDAVLKMRGINWKNLGSAIIQFIKAGLSAAGAMIKTALTGIGETALNAFKSINWLNLGKNVVAGIVSGITGAAGKLVSSMTGLASKAISTAKSALGIHSPSAVFRDEVGQWIPKGVAAGISNNIGTAIDATSSLTKSVVSSVKSAKGEKTGENYAKSIVNGIKKQKKYAKKSAATVGAAIVEAAEKKLKNYQTVHNTTAAYEVGFWKKIVNSCKKGTQAYYDAYSNYSAALDDYNKGMADAKKELLDLEENYAKDVAKVEEQLISDMNSLWDEYHNTVDSRSKELYKSLGGLFSAFSSKTSNTTAKMISNMKSQVEGMTAWHDSLEKLKSRGLNDELLGELKALGPEAAADVALLASMTDAELKSYVKLWKQKMDMCKNQAIEENKGLYNETLEQVEALKTDAAKEVQGLTNTFVSSVKALASKTKAELGGLPKAFSSIGKDSINGITKAIKSNGSKLTDEVKSLMTSAVKAAKKELKIKSPSRVFRDEVGVQIPAGIAIGIEKNADQALDAVDEMSNELSDYIRPDMLEGGFSFPIDFDFESIGAQLESGMNAIRNGVMDDIKMGSIRSNAEFVIASHLNGNSYDEKLEKLLLYTQEMISEIRDGKCIVLDDGTLVGKMSKKMDEALGKRKAALARG